MVSSTKPTRATIMTTKLKPNPSKSFSKMMKFFILQALVLMVPIAMVKNAIGLSLAAEQYRALPSSKITLHQAVFWNTRM